MTERILPATSGSPMCAPSGEDAAAVAGARRSPVMDSQYRALFECMGEGLAYCRMLFENDQPVDWVYLDVNPAFARLTGLTDVVGKRVSEVLPALRRENPELFEAYGRVVSTGEPAHLAAYVPALEIHFSVSVFRPEEGCFVAVFENCSERIAAEEALVAERSRLRAVIDTIPDQVWMKDPEGRFLACNPAFERLIGTSQAELLGRTDHQYFPHDLADFFRQRDRAAMEAGKPLVNEEWVSSAAEGRILLETIKAPVREPSGRLLGVLGIARDVTAVRAVAESSRQSEERLRLFIDHAPVALAMFDPEMRYLAVSRRWCEDYRLGDQPLLGRSHYELFPEIGEEGKQVHRRSLAGEVVRADEDRFARADGSVQWLKWETRPWRDATGAVAGIVIFSEDMTERHNALEKLAESQLHYQAFAETTFECIWEVDARGRYTFVSPRIGQLLGYSPEEVLGCTPFSLMPENEAARVSAVFWDSVARREAFAALENVNRHKDGRLVVLESSGVPFFGPDGELRGYRGMDRDITDRKQAERRSATQAEVSRVLAASSSLTEAAPGVLAAIGESEGWSFGALWTCDTDPAELACVAWWAAAGLVATALGEQTNRLRLGRGEGFPGRVWAQGCPLASLDLPSDLALARRQGVADLGLTSAIGFPIRLNDELFGVVEFLGSHATEPEPALLEIFDAIGRQLGLFVERRRSEATVRRFVSGSPAVIYALRVEPAGLRLVWFSDNLEQLTGWKSVPEDNSEWWHDNVHPEDREVVRKSVSVPYEVHHQVVEFRFRRPDGQYLWLRDEKRLLRDADGRPSEVVGSWSDITERVELEEKLRVAQKLEAIGRLAGGVAHDFNNMLTVISGNSEMLAKVLPEDGSERALLMEIREAAERSATLTRQLLAFSRSQVLAPRVWRLDEIVRGLESMLRRLLGEDLTLVCDLDPASGHVLVDLGQVEQVIVNLAVNARDAMPRGGTLTLATAGVVLDAKACRTRAGLSPGTFARLTVSDNGCGMAPKVVERIFEPFFTTKPVGTGTGLGLSSVFGIIQQSAGHIDVQSVEGAGTRFEIFLPRVPAPEGLPSPPAKDLPSSPGSETVLLVEDETAVRRMVRLALERQGYKVLVAASGREAIAIAEQHRETIDLLLTDLVMPQMSGSELSEALRARYPRLAVLLMSGYVEDDFVRHGVSSETVAFLHKPFTLAELGIKVREALAADPT